MSIGDDVREVLPFLRSEAEALLADTGTVTRGGGPVFDPNTGLLTVVGGTEVHSGPCRVRQPNAVENEMLFGEEQVTASRFIVDFPHDVTGVHIDDVITVSDSDDPDVLTRQFRVVSVPAASFVVFKAFPCVSVE